MLLLQQLNQLSHFKQIRMGGVIRVQKHHLNDLGLDGLIYVEELLDVVSVDDVLGFLRLTAV